jgi:hypothetical protein
MYLIAYDTQVSAMYMKSKSNKNDELDKKIINILSKIINQNEEIKEKLTEYFKKDYYNKEVHILD